MSDFIDKDQIIANATISLVEQKVQIRDLTKRIAELEREKNHLLLTVSDYNNECFSLSDKVATLTEALRDLLSEDISFSAYSEACCAARAALKTVEGK